MNPGRVLQMSVGEVACRGRQEACKWLERAGWLGPRLRAAPRSAPEESHAGPSSAAHLAPFFGGLSERFFPGATVREAAALLVKRIPEARDRVLAAAERICAGRFDLLGYRGLSFGDPIDWHLDPISGTRAPLRHWSRIDPLDPSVVGDVKVAWELNRHQWLARLGQAYRLTGNERYAKIFAERLRSWMRANPPGMGVNWVSSLEVSLRIVSWCWALALFEGSRELCTTLFAPLVRQVRLHAAHIERYLSFYFSPNTHLTGEALGLLYAGSFFPWLRGSGRWREMGARILVEQSERQVGQDGVHFERSTCYQRYTVEIYLHFLILAARSGLVLPASVAKRVQGMLDFLLAIQRPDGSVPQIGDADGGWLLPLEDRSPGDCRGLFSTAAALFRRSDYAWAAGGPQADAVWLLGTPALEELDSLSVAPPTTPPSRLFLHGGYVVMRSGWEARASQMIFDVGPLGCPVSGAHGHADLLSIQCCAFGEPCLVDPGTGWYGARRRWRDFFRSTTAHSTIRVDGQEQASPAGPFSWKQHPRTRLLRWVSTQRFDLAEAEHDAYRLLPDAVVHRRRVLFVKPRHWVVQDELEGSAEHEVELRLQFAPLRVTADPDGWVRAHGEDGRGLCVRIFSGVPMSTKLVEGGLAPIQGWVSPDYGRCQPAPVLVCSMVARLPVRLVTVLVPVEDLSAPPPAISGLEGEGLGDLIPGDGGKRVRFEERAIGLECR